jgi:hypothetical protein
MIGPPSSPNEIRGIIPARLPIEPGRCAFRQAISSDFNFSTPADDIACGNL